MFTYAYDKRGNLIKEMEGDTLLHDYTCNAANRLAHAWNHKGEEAFYTYNGLGQRVGRRTSIAGEEETETYLLDFTRPYHNLLGIEKGNSRKTFYWDGNVIAMEEENNTPALPEESMQTNGNIPTAGMHYYLLDELGSPLRVNGYAEGDKSAYLTYGYDEFGNDLYEDLEEAGIPNPYSRQGEEQPFGYTGYRYDNISHSYFAQAREYQPENGRFNAEDVIKGNGAFPETLNHYGYCLNNPMGYVDLDGRKVISAISKDAFEKIGKKIEALVRELNIDTKTEKTFKDSRLQDYFVNADGKIVQNYEDYNVEERTELIEYIKNIEDFSSVPYKATSSEIYYTIGYGHYCDDPTGSDAQYLTGEYVMTEAEAEELLVKDLQERIPEAELMAIYANGGKLYDYQIDVLVSMNYNNGKINPSDSKEFTKYLVNQEYTEADTLHHLLTYVTCEGEILPGLVKRRVMEAIIFSGYGYPNIQAENAYSKGELVKFLYDYANSFGEERAKYCLE